MNPTPYRGGEPYNILDAFVTAAIKGKEFFTIELIVLLITKTKATDLIIKEQGSENVVDFFCNEFLYIDHRDISSAKIKIPKSLKQERIEVALIKLHNHAKPDNKLDSFDYGII